LARQQPFARWLIALGAPLSPQQAVTLKSWHQAQQLPTEAWRTMAGIGAKRARQVVDFLQHPPLLALVNTLETQEIAGFVPEVHLVNGPGADN
jgi:DNA ligase (NAD+)